MIFKLRIEFESFLLIRKTFTRIIRVPMIIFEVNPL